MSAHEAIPPDDPQRMAQAITAIQASYVNHQDLMRVQADFVDRIDNLRIDLTATINRRIDEQNGIFSDKIDTAGMRATQACTRWGIGMVLAVILGLSPMYAMIFTMNRELGGLSVRVGQLEVKVDKLDERVGRLEVKVDKLEAKVASVEAKVDRVEAKVDTVAAKVDNLDAKVDQLASDLAAIKAALIKPSPGRPRSR
jgi:outer membrane murein-binding lipoprotein Lpp